MNVGKKMAYALNENQPELQTDEPFYKQLDPVVCVYCWLGLILLVLYFICTLNVYLSSIRNMYSPSMILQLKKNKNEKTQMVVSLLDEKEVPWR